MSVNVWDNSYEEKAQFVFIVFSYLGLLSCIILMLDAFFVTNLWFT